MNAFSINIYAIAKGVAVNKTEISVFTFGDDTKKQTTLSPLHKTNDDDGDKTM